MRKEPFPRVETRVPPYSELCKKLDKADRLQLHATFNRNTCFVADLHHRDTCPVPVKDLLRIAASETILFSVDTLGEEFNYSSCIYMTIAGMTSFRIKTHHTGYLYSISTSGERHLAAIESAQELMDAINQSNLYEKGITLEDATIIFEYLLSFFMEVFQDTFNFECFALPDQLVQPQAGQTNIKISI